VWRAFPVVMNSGAAVYFPVVLARKQLRRQKLCVQHIPLPLVSCRTVLWVVVIEENSKVVFLNKLPCYACIHCHHKACIVLFQILYAFLVCTAETPSALEFHNSSSAQFSVGWFIVEYTLFRLSKILLIFHSLSYSGFDLSGRF